MMMGWMRTLWDSKVLITMYILLKVLNHLIYPQVEVSNYSQHVCLNYDHKFSVSSLNIDVISKVSMSTSNVSNALFYLSIS